jgi:hypothetical protein
LEERRPEKVPNVFPGNWDVDSPELLKAFELSSKQNWDTSALPWDDLDSNSFDSDDAVAQAYWMAKLALFERSGISAFGLAGVQAARFNFQDPAKKFFSAVSYDECKHDEFCRRSCARLCPGFPYRYKPKNELQEKALRNISCLYDNATRYWSAFERAWDKIPIGVLFSGFFFSEIAAQLTFRRVSLSSNNKFYRGAFVNIMRDETRHVSGAMTLMEQLAAKMSAEEKMMITRQMKHSFIYLSPLLYNAMSEFWRLPKDFVTWDTKLEEIAFKAGLGVPTLEEKKRDWYNAVSKEEGRLKELGIKVPAIREVGIDGVEITVKKSEEIAALPL